MNDIKFEFGVPQTGIKRHSVMRRLVQSFPKGFINILEVGSYEGCSAIVWSHSVFEHSGSGNVLCIDPWKPYIPWDQAACSQPARMMNADLASGEVYERFKKNTAKRDGMVPINHFIGTFQDWNAVGLMIFDIVFLDGAHDYRSVLNDIELAATMIKPGGILCGDDLEKQADELDIDSIRPMADREYIPDFHPGVTLAVWDAMGGRVWCEEGVWAVRYMGNGIWSTTI